jgi:ribonuclease VapC
MIVVDTSALMAIVLDEPAAERCMGVLETEDRLLISAGTLAEALIVGARRGIGEEIAELVAGLDVEVVPVTSGSARRMAGAYARWGKGIHPAALNFGDCFAYALAAEQDCPLLFVGNDFSSTDVKRAL